MARGMVNGEPINTQAQSKEFDEGYDRTFGPRKEVQRGRFIWDEKARKLVPAAEYRAQEEARTAPIMCDRYMEGVAYDMGDQKVDIGSRSKRRAFMKATGWADSDDFKGQWKKAEQDRKRFFEKGGNKERREAIERMHYELSKRKPRAR
jgi:hypothetical protein